MPGIYIRTQWECWTMQLQPYAAKYHGFSELTNAYISMETDKLYGEMPDGRRILLADGRSWRLDDVGKQLQSQSREVSVTPV